MRILVWLVRAAIFFTLFAFALNNQQEAAIRWFFGQEWRAPMVFIVLGAFAIGCAFGAVAMVPAWWRHRRIARRQSPAAIEDTEVPAGAVASEPVLQHPPRDGL
jgi:putative membrane protein